MATFEAPATSQPIFPFLHVISALAFARPLQESEKEMMDEKHDRDDQKVSQYMLKGWQQQNKGRS